MILHTQPGKRWNDHDFLLLEAYQVLEAERCSQCGQLKWICHNDDSDVGFKIHEDVCYAMREIEETDRENSKSKNYVKPAGAVAVPEPFRYSKKPFDWEFREAFYTAEYEKKKAIAESESLL